MHTLNSMFSLFQLYDRINTRSLTPVKSPPSDSVTKTREVSTKRIHLIKISHPLYTDDCYANYHIVICS